MFYWFCVLFSFIYITLYLPQVVKLVLESLESVCLGDPETSWLTDILGDILGVLTTFLHFGLQGWQYQPPYRLFPLPGAQWEPPPAPNIKVGLVTGIILKLKSVIRK